MEQSRPATVQPVSPATAFVTAFGAMFRALERNGLKTLVFSWSHPDHPAAEVEPDANGLRPDPPPGVAVTWHATAEFWHDHHATITSAYGPIADMQAGIIGALEQIGTRFLTAGPEPR